MTSPSDATHHLLVDIRDRLIQQQQIEQVRTSLLETIIELLKKLAATSTGDGDDAVLSAIAEMNDGIRTLTELISALVSQPV